MDQYSNAVKLWKSHNIETEADLDQYLDSFRILFAYHSSKIENPSILYDNTRDLFQSGKVSNFSGSPRTLTEQQNQKLCYETLKKKIIAKEPLSVELVREVHGILTAGTYDIRRYVENGERPGSFKKHDYVTGLLEVGSSAENTEKDVQELLEEINEYTGDEVLKAGTYFHARFEYIHPFADGNGPVGRTLLNYYLMTHNHPPLIVYDEDKRTYFEALGDYDADEELLQLFTFFRRAVEKTWEKMLSMTQGNDEPRKGLQNFVE